MWIQFVKISTDIFPETSFQIDFSLPSIIHALIPGSHHLHHSQARNLVHFHSFYYKIGPCCLSFYLLNISLNSALTFFLSFCGPCNLTTVKGDSLSSSVSPLHTEWCHFQHAILSFFCVFDQLPTPLLIYSI